MSLHKRVAPRQLPPPPQQPAPNLKSIAQQQLAQTPQLHGARIFWKNLQEFGEWWLLVPLLLWVGWRTYRTERRKVLRERAERAQATASAEQPGD
jgi:hypothetical protein